VLLLVLLLALLSACDPPSPPTTTPTDGTDPATGSSDPTSDPATDPASVQAGPKIVSLTPAITQMLTDMGKRSQIVGVSADDDAAINLPRCGTYNDPLTARILELGPDVVLTEAGRSEIPAMLRTLESNGVFELHAIPHSLSIADVQRALVDPDTGLGQAVDDPASAERARRLMQMRLDLVHTEAAQGPKPRVLMLLNPARLGAIGTGVTHDELLQLAGATNAASSFDTGYLTLSRTQVQQMRPDVILIFEPGGVELMDNDPRLRVFDGMDIPAVVNHRIVVIRHRQAMLPSTSLPSVLVEMACAIHPERAAAIRAAYGMAQQVIERSDQNSNNSTSDSGGGGS